MDEDTRIALYKKHKCRFTKKLRRKMTPAEQRLWTLLRNRNSRGIKFRIQVNIGPYIADFLCKEHDIIVEVDGGIHNKSEQKEHDKDRDAYLCNKGYSILRIQNCEIFNHPISTLHKIHSFIKTKQHKQTVPFSLPRRGPFGTEEKG